MNDHRRIIIVDDDQSNRESLAAILEKEGHVVAAVAGAPQALQLLAAQPADLVISDLRMPAMDGLAFLKEVKKAHPAVEMVLLTAFGTVEVAVQAMKEGAYDFITKPVKRLDVVKLVAKALEKQALTRENLELKNRLAELGEKKELLGSSPLFRQVLEMVQQVAPSQSTVLIEGESGTGKELVAHAIHAKSARAAAPFIKFSCASIPETLLEAELFGYEKGAFTGAAARKAGRFELADRGTLFLDEIAEVPLAVQVKLLRVLQEGEFERLGSNKTQKSDVRIIAATNQDLKAAVDSGAFREDLYYRLNVIKLHLPPLRERHGDVPLLAQYFLAQYAAANRRTFRGIHPDALALLCGYSWPGNVRELENVIERATVLARGEEILPDDLPRELRGTPSQEGIAIPFGMPLEEVERLLIDRTLHYTQGDKNEAARLLGIHPRTIYRKTEPPQN